jgi:hypothetical protein
MCQWSELREAARRRSERRRTVGTRRVGRRSELREAAGRRSERRGTVGLCGSDSVLLRSCCHGRIAKG